MIDTIIQGDCLEVMKDIPDKSIDLVVTSPPYDNLRMYKGYTFDFESIAKELYRITKQGGVVVWVVGDQTVNGSESGTSFRQALYFKEIGFNLHDTMIYDKDSFQKPDNSRYWACFEYMFVFSKGIPKSCNLIKDRLNSQRGKSVSSKTVRNIDGTTSKRSPIYCISDYGKRKNVWSYSTGYGKGTTDKCAYQHPAIFPEALARDHILSWSNEGDLVFDPMCGSGTTCKMAVLNNRHYLGCDISQEYVNIANNRVADAIYARDSQPELQLAGG